MKALLTVTAVIEVGAGLLMSVIPGRAITFLFGSSPNTPVELVLARLFGVALLALGIACWLGRDNRQRRAARGLVGAMLLYNAGVVLIFAYAGIGVELSGIGLWPAVLLHVALIVWCLMRLLHKPV